jgi:AraC family transcriptional regulator
VRGGLAPVVRRRLADYIEAHLDRTSRLGMLAELACLSEYHLVRMFKVRSACRHRHGSPRAASNARAC